MIQNLRVTPEQEALLLKEGYLSYTMLGHGLTALRRASILDKGSFYHAFFALTIGLERLMKLMLIQKYRVEHKNSFPDNGYLRQIGHNIGRLFVEVGGDVGGIYSNVKDQEVVNDMLNVLTCFANQARYYNLDTLTSNQLSAGRDPIKDWKDIQEKIVSVKQLKLSLTEGERQFANFINDLSYTRIFDANDQIIEDFTELVATSKLEDKTQGYATHYVLKIIMHLADILKNTEYEAHLYPYLREFFAGFNDYGRTPSQIRRKRNWSF